MDRNKFELKASVIISASDKSGNDKLNALMSLYDQVEDDCIKFGEWINNSQWTSVYSKELDKSAWVDCSEQDVHVFGSDYHFTRLIKEYGHTTKELYKIFKQDVGYAKSN